MTTIKSPNITWIDIKNPSPKELKFLAENYRLHPVILEHLKGPTVRSNVEEYNGYIYAVLHFPVYNPEKKISESTEIDFIITPDTLITARYQNIEPFEEFIKKCKPVSSPLKRDSMNRSSIYLFYHLVKNLYSFSLRELDHIDEKIILIEEAIFSGHEKEMLLALSLVRSDVLNFLRTLKPQGTVLESLIARSESFEIQTKPYLIDLIGEHNRVISQSENHRDSIEGLQATNESLLNAKTNEIMKVLTIMAFVILPLTLVSSLFSMNTSVLPIVGSPYDFWIITGSMTVLAIIFFAIFKHKKWL